MASLVEQIVEHLVYVLKQLIPSDYISQLIKSKFVIYSMHAVQHQIIQFAKCADARFWLLVVVAVVLVVVTATAVA